MTLTTKHRLTSFNEFLLLNELNYTTKGNYSLILNNIQDCCKTISGYVRNIGLVDLLGYESKTNASGDLIAKLDVFANSVFAKVFKNNKLLYAFTSEEEKRLFKINKDSEYILSIDPLDGSKQSQIQLPSGTIFCLYKKHKDNFLTIKNIVCAGYCLYSSATVLLYVDRFRSALFLLDSATGNFFLTKKNLKLPNKGSDYSVNEAYINEFFDKDKNFINLLKDKNYSLRYVGTLVADMHRTILQGGVFLYPFTKNNKEGKLRIIFEILPFSFIIKRLGGKVITSADKIIFSNKTIHKKADFIAGSIEELKNY
ncbi:MAG: fructose-1,6-bisphosphatase class 1 [Patescibacteria group bacterium]|nr:MAG: fructose-1,6-bisphosphatase class 1 [Patescibacteria group bacterium]